MKPATGVIFALLGCGLAACAQPNKSQMVSTAATPAVAIPNLIAQANAGNDKAAVMLAAFNIKTGNMPAAFHWMKLAADRGSPIGEAGLGLMYSTGFGVPQNYQLALKFDRLSADKNNSAGLNNLGWLYEHGLGVPADPVEAVRLYRRSAMLGNPAAQASLGRCLDMGIGTVKDLRLAYFWYNLAASKAVGAMLVTVVTRRDILARHLPSDTVSKLQAAASLCQPGTAPPASSRHRPDQTDEPGQPQLGNSRT